MAEQKQTKRRYGKAIRAIRALRRGFFLLFYLRSNQTRLRLTDIILSSYSIAYKQRVERRGDRKITR